MRFPPLEVLRPVGQHPYATWITERDAQGQFWLHFNCSACGDQTSKPCTRPHLATRWALQYAALHAHGLRPKFPAPGVTSSDGRPVFAELVTDEMANFAAAYGAPPPPNGWRR